MDCKSLLEMVRSAMATIAIRVQERSGFEILQIKASGDPTRRVDVEIENLYVRELKRILGSVRIKSEESDWSSGHLNTEFVAFVDPIDGTEMASRQVALYSTAVTVARSNGELLFSAVGDVAMNQIFWADSTHSYLDDLRLCVTGDRELSNAFLVNYSMSADRARHPGWALDVFGHCGRFLNYGGPLFLAKIADGTVDGVLEYQKGYFLYDLLPGLHIAQNAGGMICGLGGEKLEFANHNGRYRFIATSSERLQREILGRIAVFNDGILRE